MNKKMTKKREIYLKIQQISDNNNVIVKMNA